MYVFYSCISRARTLMHTLPINLSDNDSTEKIGHKQNNNTKNVLASGHGRRRQNRTIYIWMALSECQLHCIDVWKYSCVWLNYCRFKAAIRFDSFFSINRIESNGVESKFNEIIAEQRSDENIFDLKLSPIGLIYSASFNCERRCEAHRNKLSLLYEWGVVDFQFNRNMHIRWPAIAILYSQINIEKFPFHMSYLLYR